MHTHQDNHHAGDGEVLADPKHPEELLTLVPEQIDDLCQLMKLLSDKTRLAVLQMLSVGEMNVTSLCQRLQLPQPTVSHHLGLLRNSRLIDNRRAGKQIFYRLNGRVAPLQPREGKPADADSKAPAATNGTGASEHDAEGSTLDPTDPNVRGMEIKCAGFSLQLLSEATGRDPVADAASAVRDGARH